MSKGTEATVRWPGDIVPPLFVIIGYELLAHIKIPCYYADAFIHLMDRWCSPVNTSPCHGEDRGFESRPVRQKNNLNTSGCFSVCGPEASH